MIPPDKTLPVTIFDKTEPVIFFDKTVSVTIFDKKGFVTIFDKTVAEMHQLTAIIITRMSASL